MLSGGKQCPVLNYQPSDVVMFTSSFYDAIYLHTSPEIQNRLQRKQNKNKKAKAKRKETSPEWSWLFPEKSKVLFVSVLFSPRLCGLSYLSFWRSEPWGPFEEMDTPTGSCLRGRHVLLCFFKRDQSAYI